MQNIAQDDIVYDLEQAAIKAAMDGAWDQAIHTNLKIIKLLPKNTAALNRLARAYCEKGNLSQARQTYQKVLQIEPYNQIAIKNLKRLADQKQTLITSQKTAGQRKFTFIEEPGKTKSVKLIRLASPEILATIDSGDEVSLIPKKHIISVVDSHERYLGSIPDDLSHRLLKLIKNGNRYQSFVRAVDRQNLEIFIRETKKGSQCQYTPSFTPHPAFSRKIFLK